MGRLIVSHVNSCTACTLPLQLKAGIQEQGFFATGSIEMSTLSSSIEATTEQGFLGRNMKPSLGYRKEER